MALPRSSAAGSHDDVVLPAFAPQRFASRTRRCLHRAGRRLPLLPIGAVLAIQNLLYFAPHWVRGDCFTGDFVKTYHAVPHYLIQAFQAGVGIDWIPVGGMGYPTALNLQSGLFYPPFWAFAVTGATYSMKAAIVLQCLTVMFGALGCAVLARGAGLTWGASLLAGVIFQGFGGFILNSMHVDIVRGFAFTPWVLAPFVAGRDPRTATCTRATLLVLPLNVYLLWTGGYPGITIAVFVAAATMAVVRALADRDVRGVALPLAGLVIGTLLASPAIAPAILLKTEIARSGLAEDHRDFGAARDLFALVYDTDSMFFAGHDTTMKSLSVGLPALALLLAGVGTPKPRAVRWLWPLLVVGAVMGSGVLAPLWRKVAPQLLYSRFQFSDYKVVFLMPLIVTAAAAFDRRRSWSTTAPSALIWLVAVGNAIIPRFAIEGEWSKSALPPHLRYLALVLSCFMTLACLRLQARTTRRFALALLVGIIVLDWGRIHWKHHHAALKHGVALFDSGRQFEPAGTPFRDQTVRLRETLRHPPARRPARLDIDTKHYCWRGYYSGEYLMQDWSGPMQFVNQRRIMASPELRRFAAEPWTAVWLQPGADAPWSGLERCDATPREYGTDRIVYGLRAPSGGTYAVNELFFPGWRAVARNVADGVTLALVPRSVDGFRAYTLPAGEFEIVETFATPHLPTWSMVAVIGLGLFTVYATTVAFRRGAQLDGTTW